MEVLTEDSDVLTTKQVADKLKVSTRTVQCWVNSGDLPAFKHGKVIRIAPDALAAFIMKGCRTDRKTQPTGGSPTPMRRAGELDVLLARKTTPTPKRKSKGSAASPTPRDGKLVVQ